MKSKLLATLVECISIVISSCAAFGVLSYIALCNVDAMRFIFEYMPWCVSTMTVVFYCLITFHRWLSLAKVRRLAKELLVIFGEHEAAMRGVDTE